MTLPLAILAFLVGLVLLERGADLFTDQVGEAAKRGVAALVRPLTIDRTTRAFDVPFLLGLSLLTALLFFRPRLSRPSGTLLLALYAFYLYANYAWK